VPLCDRVSRRSGRRGATAQTYTTGVTKILVTSSRYILTAYHIVEGATEVISVTLGDGTKSEAEFVGYSPTFEDGGYDAALLKTPAVNLPAIPPGDSDDVQLFDQVIVLGYPLSFELGSTSTPPGGTSPRFAPSRTRLPSSRSMPPSIRGTAAGRSSTGRATRSAS
jgi:serine protease Do